MVKMNYSALVGSVEVGEHLGGPRPSSPGPLARAQSMLVFVRLRLARVTAVIWPARSPCYRVDLWRSGTERTGGGRNARGGLHLAR